MGSLMRKKGSEKLRAQASATVAGLFIAAVILAAAFIPTRIYIVSLEKRLTPMLDTALDAVNAENFDSAAACGKHILGELRRAEPGLKLFLNHRDIMEMMRFAEELSMLGEGGDRAAYISAISGVSSWLEMLRETTDVTVNDIL